jgi:hypothetical protein
MLCCCTSAPADKLLQGIHIQILRHTFAFLTSFIVSYRLIILRLTVDGGSLDDWIQNKERKYLNISINEAIGSQRREAVIHKIISNY